MYDVLWLWKIKRKALREEFQSRGSIVVSQYGMYCFVAFKILLSFNSILSAMACPGSTRNIFCNAMRNMEQWASDNVQATCCFSQQ